MSFALDENGGGRVWRGCAGGVSAEAMVVDGAWALLVGQVGQVGQFVVLYDTDLATDLCSSGLTSCYRSQ